MKGGGGEDRRWMDGVIKETASAEQNASVTATLDVKGNRFRLRKDKRTETMCRAGEKGTGHSLSRRRAECDGQTSFFKHQTLHLRS